MATQKKAPPDFRQGEFDVSLANGRTYRLSPTLGAALEINKHFGGFLKAIDRLGEMDLEAAIVVVQYGADLTPRGMEGLPEAVWRTGLPELINKSLIPYVGMLSNGGKPLRPDKDGDEGAGGEGEG